MSDLSDFFKLVSEDKKKKKEEFDSVVGDLGLDSLFGEFAALKKKEKEKKVEEQIEEEFIIGKITLDSVFEEVVNLKKETKKKKIQEENTVKAFEKWLYSETPKQQKEIIEDVIEESLEEVLEVLEEHKEELEQPTLIEKSLGLLSEPSDTKVQQDPVTPLNQKFATLDDLHKHYSTFLSRIQQQLSTLGGGGETRLEFLDDVDRDSAKRDNYFLKYDVNINKWVGDDGGGVGITSIVFITGVTTYYSATRDVDYIGVSADVPVTIDLPISPAAGKEIIIKDEGNKISTYNITVRAGVGASVENDSSVIMKINHESFTYFYNGYNWYIV
jgi:hypothetical protein